MDGFDTDELIARLRHWIRFIGIRRLVVGVAAVALAAAGAWLVLSPSGVPTEFSLPHATSVPVGAAASPAVSVVPSGRVTVHVTGAVVHPGVYALDADSRVVDAVRAAGGATSRADLERINLALRLVDTEQVWVPSRASSAPRATVAPRLRTTHTTVKPTVPGATTLPVGSSSGATGDGRININTATASQLEQLPGVGPATAKAIIDYRRRSGPFSKVDDLDRVPGIGPAKVAAIKPKATVG